MSIYSTRPFQLVNDLMSIPFGQDVYVVSDAKYKELQQEREQKEITNLQTRITSYEQAADRLRETLLSLPTAHDLMPPDPENPHELPRD